MEVQEGVVTFFYFPWYNFIVSETDLSLSHGKMHYFLHVFNYFFSIHPYFISEPELHIVGNFLPAHSAGSHTFVRIINSFKNIQEHCFDRCELFLNIDNSWR